VLAEAEIASGTERDAEPLARLLYERWFHATTGARQRYPAAWAYRAVALGARPFEAGWTIEAPLPGATGAVRLRRGSSVRDVPPLAWAPEAPPKIALEVGDAALAAPLRDGPEGGFWHIWSPVWPKRTPRRLSRWYLQVAEGAELGAAFALAAQAPIDRAWAAKLLAGDHLSGRRDVAVFYAPLRGDGWIAALFESLAPHLEDRPGPPFTEPVGRGISRADDPGGGLSFGQHCCRLLASAALECPESLTDPGAWRAAVARRFAESGVSLERPWHGHDDA
jgi:hypothetical protein